jgi:RHS repeat-associated protein
MGLNATTRLISVLFLVITLAISVSASAATFFYQGGAFDPGRCLPPWMAACASGPISGSVTFAIPDGGYSGSVGSEGIVSYSFAAGGAGGVSNGYENPNVNPVFYFDNGHIYQWDFDFFSSPSGTYPGTDIRSFTIGAFPYSSDNYAGNWDAIGNWASYGATSTSGHWFGGKSIGACDSPTAPPGGVGCANPISIGTGAKYQQFVDYETAGQNRLSFIRSYNSYSLPDTYAVTMGRNWRHNYDRYLHFVSSADYIDAERADGQIVSFISSGGAWGTDTDIFLQLASSGSNWLLTDRDGNVETYSSAGGRGQLDTIRQRNGYTQTLSYSTGVLASVSDSYSRSLSFSYSSSTGFLTNITTPDTLALTYGYTMFGSASTLTSIAYNTSPVTQQTYHYEDTDYPYALTGITDENGNRYATWAYDDTGRAVLSEHALGADHTEVTYDDSNNTRVVTGPLGIVETYTFTYLQGVPKVAQIDRASNGTVDAASRTLTYDANGYLASETDWNGNLTSYTNNSNGDPTTIVVADGSGVAQTTSIVYGSATYPNLPTQITTSGLIQTLNYDSSGRLLTNVFKDQASQSVPYFTSGDTRTYTYTWNSTGQLLSVQLPRTDVTAKTTFGYTGGTLTSITDALSYATNILTFKSGGWPLTVTDQNSVLTTLSYNNRNWLTSSILSLSSGGSLTTTLAYDSAGNLTRQTLPDASYLAYGYDNAHRMTSITNNLSESQTLTYNSAGNITQHLWKDSGATTKRQQTATFDALGRMLTSVGGMSQSTAFAYDSNDNVLTITDPLGSVTTLTYDSANRLSTSTDPLTNLTSLTYDEHDRVLSVTDPRGKVTSYVYDGYGDLIQETSPDRGTWVMRYSSNGYITQQTDAGGNVTNMTYDALDRILTRAYPADSALNVAFTYDQSGHGKGIGRLTSLTDAAGSLSLNYEERGLVTVNNRTISSNAYNTGFSYDSAGRVGTITYASSGWLVTYTRDSAGQVTTVTDKPPASGAVNIVTSVTHMPFGPVKSMSYGNGITETRTYDLDYRTTAIKAANGGTNIYYSSFGYNANDNVTSILDNVTTSRNQTLNYDSSNWIKFASGTYGTYNLTYDSSGNRKTYGATSYTIGSSNNQMTAVGASSLTFSSTGNITTWPGATATYNKANQLATAVAGGVTSTYKYDAFGYRLSTVPGTARAKIYTYGTNSEYLTESNAGVKTDYVYMDGFPVAAVQPAASTVSAIHTDYLGTPQKATNSAKTVVWNGSYDPNGNVTIITGGITQNLRFPGQVTDASGLHYNVFRNYIPRFASGGGRYLEADPIGLAGGINPYVYVTNNAYAFIDPLGLRDVLGSVFQALLPVSSAQFSNAPIGGSVQSQVDYGRRISDLRAFEGSMAGLATVLGPSASLAPTEGLVCRVAGPALGDLTAKEIAQIQAVVNRAGRPLEVVGSAARGARTATSDIDYVVAPSSLRYFEGLERNLPRIDLEHGLIPGAGNPNIGPIIRFEPR